MLGLLSLGTLQDRFQRLDLRSSGLTDYGLLAVSVCSALAAFGACVLTQSRTSLFLSLILGAILVVVEWRNRRRPSRILAASVIAVLLGGLGFGASQIASRWDSLLADAGVRVDAYGHYLSALMASPLFGYGWARSRPSMSPCSPRNWRRRCGTMAPPIRPSSSQPSKAGAIRLLHLRRACDDGHRHPPRRIRAAWHGVPGDRRVGRGGAGRDLLLCGHRS
uniref:O-antigen ligase family protein n=1 Tax=Phenylobacterium glaciei TaxID=2803784 RepID=A0A974SAC0_9CAUL|nr:O-antigen ligase family protein [Phenylobacterium glaciei]